MFPVSFKKNTYERNGDILIKNNYFFNNFVCCYQSQDCLIIRKELLDSCERIFIKVKDDVVKNRHTISKYFNGNLFDEIIDYCPGVYRLKFTQNIVRYIFWLQQGKLFSNKSDFSNNTPKCFGYFLIKLLTDYKRQQDNISCMSKLEMNIVHFSLLNVNKLEYFFNEIFAIEQSASSLDEFRASLRLIKLNYST